MYLNVNKGKKNFQSSFCDDNNPNVLIYDVIEVTNY